MDNLLALRVIYIEKFINKGWYSPKQRHWTLLVG